MEPSCCQEAAFAILHPLIQETVVESDLRVRVQQDNSINPSVIHAIRLEDLRHISYT